MINDIYIYIRGNWSSLKPHDRIRTSLVKSIYFQCLLHVLFTDKVECKKHQYVQTGAPLLSITPLNQILMVDVWRITFRLQRHDLVSHLSTQWVADVNFSEASITGLTFVENMTVSSAYNRILRCKHLADDWYIYENKMGQTMQPCSASTRLSRCEGLIPMTQRVW